MKAVAQQSEMTQQFIPLRDAFLRWQCRVRQISMRENFGRPDDAIKPRLTLNTDSEPIGDIITVLSRTPSYSKTPEMRHMVQSIFDPSQRREKAIQFFSEIYYQKFLQFSDTLTAAFSPNSPVAEAICAAKASSLTFENYGQRFDLDCSVSTLTKNNPLFQATWWHNKLFNPHLLPGTVILGFEPDWSRSSAEPNFTTNIIGELE